MSKSKFKCRTCFKGSKGLQLLTKMIVEKKEQTISFGDFLKDITNINIMDKTYAKMPQYICGNCISKLKASYAFVQQAQMVHIKLLSMINEEDNADRNKITDCLQETPIDIQNCLEIKLEKENPGEISEDIISTEKLLEEQNVENDGMSRSTDISKIFKREENANDKSSTCDALEIKTKNESISECGDDYRTDDIFDEDYKNTEILSDNDDESTSSNESDFVAEPIRKKKKKGKKTKFDDNIPASCEQCERVFANSRLLKQHKSRTHVPEELKVQCPYCPAKYGRRHYMYVHMRTLHKDKPIEDHIIKQKRKLPRQYACEQCDGIYTSKYYLLAHVKLKHNPDSMPKKNERVMLPKKRFLCSLCGSKFDTPSNLKIHVRRHTGEKPYKCDLCDRAYYLSCDLRAHRRSHTGEKPFICKVCEKGFAKSNKLKIHMRSHSDERPYKCDQCEKAFKDSKNLKIHKRLHTGERPYTCGVCQNGFIKSTALRYHQAKTQHLETIDQVAPS